MSEKEAKKRESTMFQKNTILINENDKLKGQLEQLLKDKGDLTDKIADIKVNCDYVLEGKEIEYREERKKLCDGFENMKATLESQIATLGERCNQLLKDKGNLTDELDERTKDLLNANHRIGQLEQQIEKMKICQNCKFEDKDYLEEPCNSCSRCLGSIKRKGTSDKWELEND